MSYATPTAYLQRYGLAEAVQMLADEEQLLTAQLLTDAIAVAAGGSWTGSPTAAEIAAAQAALARLERQLAMASNFMDGYLRAVVALPLPAGNANAGTLEECCAALTRCGLADDADNATERMDKCCDTWRAWLKDVAASRVQLISDTGTTPPSSGGARTGQAASGYCWDAFGSIR